MKFEANRSIMLGAAKSVAKIAPGTSPVEVLNYILIESDENTGEVYLTATNNEVSIRQKVVASVEQSGSMLVRPSLLTGMMSLLDSELVTFSSDGIEVLRVTGGKCIYKIKCLPSKSYPKPVMPFPEENVIMTGICSLAKRTTFAVSKDKYRPALQCVKITLKNNAIHAAACDAIRMMLVKDVADPTEERDFLLPGRSLQMLATISSDTDVFEVGDIGDKVAFVRGDMIFTIHKFVTDSYLDTDNVIKGIKPAYTAVANADKVKEALNLISVSALADATKKPINLVLSGSELIVQCDNDYSEASMTVPAKISQDTPDNGFSYDVSALLKLFQVISGKVKIEIDTRGFLLVKTRNEVYLQAPVRTSAKKGKETEPAPIKKPRRAKGAEGVKEPKEAA